MRVPAGDRPRVRTSSLNLRPGQAVSNLVTATLGPDGEVVLSVSTGRLQVVVDVLGWVLPS